MKNSLTLLITFLCLGYTNVKAQDLILNKKGELMIVEIVRMDSQMTFYKDAGGIEMYAIANDKIEFFNWNARNTFTKSYEAYNYKHKIVTLDMSGNWVVLEKNYIPIERRISLVSASAFGMVLLLSMSNDSNVDFGTAILLGGIGVVCLGVSIVSGIIHYVRKHHLRNRYKIKNMNDPFAIDGKGLLPQKKSAAYSFAPARIGLGLQMSF